MRSDCYFFLPLVDFTFIPSGALSAVRPSSWQSLHLGSSLNLRSAWQSVQLRRSAFPVKRGTRHFLHLWLSGLALRCKPRPTANAKLREACTQMWRRLSMRSDCYFFLPLVDFTFIPGGALSAVRPSSWQSLHLGSSLNLRSAWQSVQSSCECTSSSCSPTTACRKFS